MSASCASCGAPTSEAARYCGGCGAPVALVAPETPPSIVTAPAALAQVDPEALDRYRVVAARFLVDGEIDAEEAAQLESLRARLGLPVEAHERVVAELRAAAPSPTRCPVVLSIDTSTMRFFETGARCLLRLRVQNAGDLGIERAEVHAQIDGGSAGEGGGERLPPSVSAVILPGHEARLSLWLVPRVAGFHSLGGVVHVVDLIGERHNISFDAVQFRVGSSEAGPRVSIVNIDQRSARVVDNSRTHFAAPAGSETGGTVAGEAVWQDVPVRAISPSLAAQLAPALLPFVLRPPSPILEAPSAARAETNTESPAVVVRFNVKTDGAEYAVDSLIARGELATIYGGTRADDGTPAVIKIADAAADNDLIQNEVRALQLLRSVTGPHLKHLPSVYGQFHTPDGRLGTVLSRLDGLDLLAVRKRLPTGIPAEHLVWIMRRALNVLGYAHSRGIVHGNVDPAHLMVRPHDHNLWLIDWSYSVVSAGQRGQTFRALNEEYGPPEAAQRKPPLPSSDLYALGKCMIFAAGGDVHGKALPEAMDPRLQRFIKFMVVESPLGRAQDAWDLYAQLDRLRETIFGPHSFREFVV